jgi:predicted nucleic acid-binding protein
MARVAAVQPRVRTLAQLEAAVRGAQQGGDRVTVVRRPKDYDGGGECGVAGLGHAAAPNDRRNRRNIGSPAPCRAVGKFAPGSPRRAPRARQPGLRVGGTRFCLEVFSRRRIFSAVFDTSVLVSAFLARHQTGGVSGGFQASCCALSSQGKSSFTLSAGIIGETLATLVRNRRAQTNYRYTPQMAEGFCAELFHLASAIDDPPPMPGAVPRDPDDDKIIACALAARVEYLVTRGRDLLSFNPYAGIAIIAPEQFLRIVCGR